MKTTRLITVLLLFALLCSSLFACSSDLLDDSTTQTKAPSTLYDDYKIDDYRLLKQDGKRYIVFDEVQIYDSDDVENQVDEASIFFNDVTEFKNAVTRGNLTEHQKSIVAQSFAKDAYGIRTCDFDRLSVPATPDSVTVDGVYWEGESYTYSLFSPEIECGTMLFMTPEHYSEHYQRQYVTLFDRDTVGVTDTSVTDDGKTVIHYTTRNGELMDIRYTLETDEKTLIVAERYRINVGYVENSDTIPSSIQIYCSNDDGACFYVWLYGFTAKPTEEWLSQFGMKLYVDPADAEK